VKFGPLTAEIGSGVWGTPANFNGFRVLALLLQRCHSLEVNQTLHDVCPSHGLVHYLYIFGSSCPLTEFCQVQNSLCIPSLTFSYIGSVTARHSSSRRQPKFAACYTRNGIAELSQRAPPIFNRPAITLGIGPHSRCI